jgi:hypothetical protein
VSTSSTPPDFGAVRDETIISSAARRRPCFSPSLLAIMGIRVPSDNERIWRWVYSRCYGFSSEGLIESIYEKRDAWDEGGLRKVKSAFSSYRHLGPVVQPGMPIDGAEERPVCKRRQPTIRKVAGPNPARSTINFERVPLFAFCVKVGRDSNC